MFQKCCCCTLRTGSLILGYVFLVLDVMGLISSVNIFTMMLIIDEYVAVAFHVGFFITLINIALDVTMINGVHTNDPKLVLPWIIARYIYMTLISIAGLIFDCILIYYTFAYEVYILLFVILLQIGGLAMFWCFLKVVHSHYKETEKSDGLFNYSRLKDGNIQKPYMIVI